LETEDIIYSQKVNTTKTRLIKSLSVSLGTALIVFLFNKNLLITTIVGIGTFLVQLFSASSKYFDGIHITKNSMKLERQTFFKESELYEFTHNQIEKVLYSESKHRKPRYIIVTPKEFGVQFHVYITSNIFKFAYGLRAMKNNGVNVELEFGDHEIKLFLDGKIPDVPMTNDMQITSDKNP
jgi:hypothetical protein